MIHDLSHRSVLLRTDLKVLLLSIHGNKTAHMAPYEGGVRGWGTGGRTLVKTWLNMAIKDVNRSMLVRMMNMSMSYCPISMAT